MQQRQQQQPHVSSFETEARRRPQSTDEALTQTKQIFFPYLHGIATPLKWLLRHYCRHSFAEIVELLEALKPVDDE